MNTEDSPNTINQEVDSFYIKQIKFQAQLADNNLSQEYNNSLLGSSAGQDTHPAQLATFQKKLANFTQKLDYLLPVWVCPTSITFGI